ncbi:MAG TPA: hypothetical protein VJ596_12515, partial [Gemmatimonadaceae bacterium]|nr:hypothetical protein [Gemmatimonadaceae bacterium]
DVGLLQMQTEEEGPFPGENFGVVRLRHPVLNRWSTLGAIATSYISDHGRMLALGADATLRVQGDDYLTMKWAATADDAESSGIALGERSQVDIGWERRTGRGLSFNLNASHSGAVFRPPIGFQPRRDFTTANAIANWYRFTDNHPVFRRVFPGALAFSTFRNADGALESGQYAVWLQWETKGGGGGWIEPKYFHENVLTPFTIGGEIHIPAGKHDFADLQLALQMAQGRKVRMNADLRAGTYFDGRRAQAILTPTWNVSPHLELGADYQITALRFPVRDESADIHVLRLRVRSALDVRLSANAFVQYNSTTDRLDFNVRARYAFAEGTDLWLVYNEGLDTERHRELPSDPMPPRSLARSFILKYTHTFGL